MEYFERTERGKAENNLGQPDICKDVVDVDLKKRGVGEKEGIEMEEEWGMGESERREEEKGRRGEEDADTIKSRNKLDMKRVFFCNLKIYFRLLSLKLRTRWLDNYFMH